jgi:carotenoid cleavage dioxygenase-like enzyme
MAANPYLEGNFAPLADELTSLDLTVQGELPRELNGRLLRIGPNPVAPNPATHHWFIGNGMVHGVRLEEGRAVWYRRRFVRDEQVIEKFGYPEIPGPAGALGTNVANTNIIELAGELYVIVEAGNMPVHLDAELETIERSNFNGGLKHGFSAHPKICPATGEVHVAVYNPFEEHVHHVVVAKDGRVIRDEPVHLPHRPMVHDCAITENYFAVLDFPCILDGAAGAEGSPLPYRWHPEQSARVGLLPRNGLASEIRWFEVEPCYVFHPMNAFETDDGRVVMDVARHPAMFASDVRGPNEGPPTLDRWTFDLASGNTKEKRLDDRAQEFPRLDERLVGKSYRYGYTAALGKGFEARGLFKHDLQTGACIEYSQGEHRGFLEPVFVPKSESATEDEGWVMAYVYDARENRSDVVVLDAQDIANGPIATVKLPDRVPFGFHGNWVPDA